MRTTKPVARELMVEVRRLGGSAAAAARWAILGVGLVVGSQIAAQEPDVLTQTNDVVTAEVLARINEMVQSADAPQPDDMPAPDDLDQIAPNGLPQTNGPAHSEGGPESTNRLGTPGRSQNDDRRSRGKRSFRSRSSQSGRSGSANDYNRGADRTQSNPSSATNGGLARLDYSAFKIIVDRNIFDPNRFPRRPGEPSNRPAPRAVDFLTLVGTMSYEKGTFAFFDGSGNEYKKALKLTDVIAGYKVATIAPKGVTLTAGTNELELSVGAQLRREEDGPWLLASQASSYAAMSASASTNVAATTTTTSSDAASGGAAESDIIKRLREKREKE